MTTIYLHNNGQAQAIHCSDGSQGVVQLAAPYYEFRFYNHQHPGFWLAPNQFHDGETMVVKDIQSVDDFRLKFV